MVTVPNAYRSYVIRVRHRSDGAKTVRLDVEDLLGGRRASLHGPAAHGLAESLRSLVSDDQMPDRGAEPVDRAESPEPSSGG